MHLFHHLSLCHHPSSALADLTASLHSFIVFIISFILVTTMASSIRMTSTSIPLWSLESPTSITLSQWLIQRIFDNMPSSTIFFTLRCPHQHDCQWRALIIFQVIHYWRLSTSWRSHLHFWDIWTRRIQGRILGSLPNKSPYIDLS
jgi:hypothetical protein